jgi:hypothetical protein
MPTNLPVATSQLRRLRKETYDTIALVVIALVALTLFVWNVFSIDRTMRDFSAGISGPSPYRSGYSPAEFSKRPARWD